MIGPQEAYHRLTREELKERLIRDPETGKQDYLNLQARCVRAFGPAAGILCRELVFLTGLSELDDGWLWNKREAWRKRTGMGNRELEKARAILRGDKPWAGVKRRVLEERRPSRRAPTEYRLDLVALAQVLLATEVSTPEGADVEPPRGASQSPHGATEPHYRATESPNGATEPPNGATEPPRPGGSESPHAGPPQRNLQKEPAQGSSQEPAGGAGAPGNNCRPAPHQATRKQDQDSYVLDGSGDTLSGPRSPETGVVPAQDGNEEGAGRVMDDHVTPPAASLDSKRIGQLWRAMEPLPDDNPTPVARITQQHLLGLSDAEGRPFTEERIAEKAREQLGGREPLAAWVAGVEDVLRVMEQPSSIATEDEAQMEEVAV